MSAAAVIILRRKKFIRRFSERGAVSPDKAIPFADLKMRRSWVFEQMVNRGVFVSVGNDRFYMNQEAAAAFLEWQQKRALVLAAVMFVIGLAVLIAFCR